MNQQEYIDSLLKKIETLEEIIRNYEKGIDNEPVKYEPLFDAEDEFFSMDEDDIKTFLYGPQEDVLNGIRIVVPCSAVKEE